MCGIAGVITGSSLCPDSHVLCRMAELMSHRGPDASGQYIAPGVGLAHCRLAIIDLTGGSQPMLDAETGLALVFNGEIYNFADVRRELEALGHQFQTRSDTEVLLRAFIQWDVGCFPRLNGMLAAAFWDPRHERLVLAVDRVGKKPLIYVHGNGAVAFASEHRPLFETSLAPCKVDPVAIDYFLRYGYIPAPHTVYCGVHRVPPAHYVVFRQGQLVTQQQYWTPSLVGPTRTDVVQLGEEFRHLLAEATKDRMVADVPLGLYLSGGVDSGAVAAAASRHVSHPIQAFTAVPQGDPGEELRLATLTAHRVGVEHHVETVTPDDLAVLLPRLSRHFGEPFGDSSAVPAYQVARVARRHVTVALTGDGGDELFGGYDRYYELPRLMALRPWLRYLGWLLQVVTPALAPNVPRLRHLHSRGGDLRDLIGLSEGGIYSYAMSAVRGRFRQQLYTYRFRRHLEQAFEGGLPFDPLAACFDSCRADRAVADRMSWVEMLTLWPGDYHRKADITSMMNSLELRSPLLDYRLVQFALSIAASAKLKNGVLKSFMKEALAGTLPPEVLVGPKIGFSVPMDTWLRSDLRPAVEQLRREPWCVQQGLLDRGAVSRLLDRYLGGENALGQLLYYLVMLEYWAAEFAGGLEMN